MRVNRRWVARGLVPLVALVCVAGVAAVPASSVVGQPTVDQAHRFLARVEVDTIANQGRACTGVLVAPQWVLTAKACFTEAGTSPAAGAPPRPSRAIVGRLDLTGTAGYAATITTLVPHPARDLLLAKLNTRITDIPPVTLAGSAPTTGESLQVAGFGRTPTALVPDSPHLAAFTVQAVTDTQLTTIGATAQATLCKGDAGGPALRLVGGQPQLVALNSTSWQGGCLGNEAETRTGGIETRVDDLAGWLHDNTIEPPQLSVVHNPVSKAQEVYAVGGDGHLHERYRASGKAWSAWADLGGTNFIGSPAAIHNPVNGALQVYAIGTNGHLYERYWRSSVGWSAWGDLAGTNLTGSPAAVHNPIGGTLEVYAIGTNGHLYERWWRNGVGWSAWTDQGGTNFAGSPAAVHNPISGALEVYAIGTNGHLYERYWRNGVGWSSWSDLAGTNLTGSPAAAHNPISGALEVYAIGTNGHLYERWWHSSSGWSSWSDLGGGNYTGRPVTLHNPVARTQEVYAVGSNGHVFGRYWTSGVGWSTWEDLATSS